MAFRAAGWSTILTGRRISPEPGYLQQDLAQPFSREMQAAIGSCDVVLHAAARSSPWGTERQFLNDNVISTQNLLDACKQNGNPRFLLISSSSVFYRPEDQLQITESTPLAAPAVNRYAATKQQAEQRVRAYPGSWAILRPRAVYGPGDTVLFPRILKAARAGRLPLLVRPSGPVIGDLIYIDNLTWYLRRAAEEQGAVGDYNLTDNEPVPIIDFLLNVFDRLGIARPTRTVSVQKAHAAALILETLFRTCLWWKEPPITRFGVHVFAWSKTFDISKAIATFGPPPVSTSNGVEAFVNWIQQENPYQ